MTRSDRTLVVTGSARGIGKAVAWNAGSAGRKIILIDIVADLLEATVAGLCAEGIAAFGYECDLSDDEQVAEAGSRIQSDHAVIDGVINNAYIPMLGRVEDIDLNDWKRALDVNLLGYVRVVKAFAPAMIARKSGHFVFTASPLGIVPSPAVAGNMLPYIATKAANIGLAQAMAAGLRPHGIDVSLFIPDTTNSWAGTPPSRVSPEFIRSLQSVIEAGDTTEKAAAILVRGMEEKRFLISADPNFEAVLMDWATSGMLNLP